MLMQWEILILMELEATGFFENLPIFRAGLPERENKEIKVNII